MSEPSSDLPPYFRRRLAALGVAAVVLLVMGWAVAGFFEDEVSGTTSNAEARGSRSSAVELPLPAYPALSSTVATSAATSAAASAPATSVPVAAAPVPSSVVPPVPTSPPPVQPAPPAQQPAQLVVPAPPQPCQDSALQVFAETGAPEYRVGQRPALRLVIANVGQLACTRDVSRQLRELVVTTGDGATRLWSSGDCYTSRTRDERTIAPGEKLTFSVNWAGRTSAPGCPSGRQTVPAGNYLVVGKLGQLVSAPTPIRLL